MTAADYSTEGLLARYGATMSLADCAELLGVHPATVARQAKAGDLPAVAIGRTRRILTAQLGALLNPESSTAAPEPESAA